MDINSLLSPSDTPRANSLTPQAPSQSESPLRSAQKTHTGHPQTSTTNSSSARAIQPPSSIPAHVRSPTHQSLQSSPLISPVPTGSIPNPPYNRSSSSQSMDTLAELASMQNVRPHISTPPLNSHNSTETLATPLHHSSVTSQARASFDIAMVETPRQLIRADYTGTSLPTEKQQRLAELIGHIQETPSAYDAHIEIIKILHGGFVDHIYPSSSPNARRDPRSYDLLADLLQARESADKVFALGEEQWLDWLQDESILAQSAEDRVGVVEKCRRAVEEEYGSAQLWSTYGDWILHCYNWANDPDGATTNGVPDEERLVGRELFPWENVTQVWGLALDHTKFDMFRSQLVWEKYLRIRFPTFDERLEEDAASQVLDLFQQRLQIPHAQWDSTFQAFSSFVSANYSDEAYEDIMATTNKAAAPAKMAWAAREQHEHTIEAVLKSADKYTEYQAFTSYLEWEKGEFERSKRRKPKGQRRDMVNDSSQSLALVTALYQRAELRMPSVVEIWEEHASFISDNRLRGLTGVLSRATKHCPWSGALWKQYLLASEISEEPFPNVETIKHDATKSGMLDAAGIEEVLKVHDAWCGYLLRRARKADAVEEDADVAEMGIRTSMEAVQTSASKMGLPASFDASFRLQRKYVEYLKGQGRLDNARKQFDDAVAIYGKHYRFWLRFYEFEMQKSLHINSLQQNSRDGVSLNSSAPFAVAILKQGLNQAELDYPEYLIEALVSHCEDYEDAEELQAALLLTRQLSKQLAERRFKENEQVAEAAPQPSTEVLAEDRSEAVAAHPYIGKRKREDDDSQDAAKRSRGENANEPGMQKAEATQELKRDREHASILVKNVPNTSETRLRQYFTSCGTVKTMRALQDEESSFVVEFNNAHEAEYALTRDGQDLDGAVISISLNTASTLYVTNYPAAADDVYIRELFKPYGEVISVRFPSLQGNKKRRFCYVDFRTSNEAHSALEVDGKNKDGFAMVVKISDPTVKKQRTDSTINKHRTERHGDSRTLFVGQLPFKATEEDVRARFEKFGPIEALRLPLDPEIEGRNKGIAFVTFQGIESAQEAIKLNGQDFQGRKLKVNATEQDGARRQRNVKPHGNSTSPGPQANGDAASPSSSAGPLVSYIEDQKERTIALCDIPDTVNEARLRVVAEAIGGVQKVILKTNHMGAIIEFEEVGAAGRAALELEGFEIVPGRNIRVTTTEEMFQQKPEKKVDIIGKPTSLAGGTVPKRPQQPGTRKAGGLGRRSAAIFKQPNGGENQGAKTNDEFRAMFK